MFNILNLEVYFILLIVLLKIHITFTDVYDEINYKGLYSSPKKNFIHIG